jgi:hypothetical protein
MRPSSRLTAQWALVSWLFLLLTLETLDSTAMFAGGLAAALMEEAKTWLVYGGALAIVLLFELAADTTYFLLSRTFVHTFISQKHAVRFKESTSLQCTILSTIRLCSS